VVAKPGDEHGGPLPGWEPGRKSGDQWAVAAAVAFDDEGFDVGLAGDAVPLFAESVAVEV
jgi:hypothetical protein